MTFVRLWAMVEVEVEGGRGGILRGRGKRKVRGGSVWGVRSIGAKRGLSGWGGLGGCLEVGVGVRVGMGLGIVCMLCMIATGC